MIHGWLVAPGRWLYLVSERNFHMNDGKKVIGKPFQPGNRLGRGRPVGSRNKATLALQTLLEGEGERITRKAIDLATAGDLTAIRICLERLIPPCRERRLRLKLPDVASAEGVSDAFTAVLLAVAEGDLAIGEAAQLANVLELARKAIDTLEVDRRLAEVEKRLEEHHEPRAA